MQETTDILIIGAGIVGLSIAYALSESGLDVTVWEQEEPGFGASGVNLGQISIIDRDSDLELSWVKRTLAAYDFFQEELGHDLEWERVGGLILLKNEVEKAEALELAARQRTRGVDVRFVKREDIREIEPCFENESVRGSVYCPDEGRFEPFNVLTALQSELRSRGVRILRREKVRSFSTEAGRIVTVESLNRTISAGTVVMATGSWTRELAADLGLEVPVYYHKGTALVTLPVEACIRSVIVSGGFLVKQKVQGMTVGLGVSPQKNGSLILGQANNAGENYSRETSFEAVAGVASNFRKYFPSLGNLEVLRSWAGNTTFTPDGNPSFGFCPSVENLFMAAGLKGAFSTAIGAGQDAAEWILGGTPDPRFYEFNPERVVRVE